MRIYHIPGSDFFGLRLVQGDSFVRGPKLNIDNSLWPLATELPCATFITQYYEGHAGPGIESRWGEILRTCPDRPWGPPSLLYNGYRVFPGGKERPGRDAEPSPLLVP